MRLAAMLLALFELAGCGLWKPEFSPPKDVAGDTVCVAVATSRASDAGMAGNDNQTQQAVFERTYSDCRAWHLSHGN